jgi:isopenicillin-N N-acyltransferase-like protein
MEGGVGDIAVIEIEGEAYERGRQYGARASHAIHQNLQGYRQLLAHHVGVGPHDAEEACRAYGPFLETHAPDLLLEMQGIADGAGCDLLEILLINARSELMGALDECTSLAAGPGITTRGQVLLGQNWDWYTALEPEPLVLRIRQPGKPEIVTLAEAGQLAKIGMNQAGLGVCLNFLSHTSQGQGLPVNVILRQMLGCAHLGEAIRQAYHPPRGGAANLLLAHAQGEILDLEMTAADADFFYGDQGWLVHANHYESDRLRAGDTGLATSMSSLARASRARRLLAAAAVSREVSLDTFRAILTDHTYGPYAICRHAVPSEPRLHQTATRASVMMDLSTRSFYVAIRQPCVGEYRHIAFGPAPDARR